MTTPARGGESGFSLVEILVALGLFSLIAWAGLSVLDGVLRTQSRTDGRLERLAELQRAMHLMTFDLEQVTGGAFLHAGGSLIFHRLGGPAGGDGVTVRYDLAEGALMRSVTSSSGSVLARQRLLDGATAIDWQFGGPAGEWLSTWPPDTKDPPLLPLAVAAEITIDGRGGGLSGVLRRVVRLPAGLPG